MSEDHPNIALLARFDPANVADTVGVFAQDALWHFYNPLLPDIHGDYVGHAGIKDFFEKVERATGGAFRVNVVSIQAFGDELVVVHRKQAIEMGDKQIESDVVVVWRMVDGQITEVWDIPSIHAAAVSQLDNRHD
ncbi:MAG: nuclear transport factor 2 family protein [Halioglobus sp.]|nr:nuclear transport factor 2 family protein [Halioglobus sp.]